jgi:endogenous inhibitor of DNA gyrase (YacG/DUF329 family)
MDSMACIQCGEPVVRLHPKAMIPFRCEPCHAEKIERERRDLAAAIVTGKERKRHRDWQDTLFKHHRNGWHNIKYVPGCEPCRIQYSSKMLPQPDTDEIPSGFKR